MDAMTCDSCGHILQDNRIGDLECINPECTGIFRVKDVNEVYRELDDKMEKEYRPTIGAEKLAEDHWDYIEKVLLMAHNDQEGYEASIEEIGFHYKSAFIHGYKHHAEGD